MFTGIIVGLGRLTSDPVQLEGGAVSLEIELDRKLVEDLKIGDSISVSGVCLTVVEKGEQLIRVDLSPETLERTNLGSLRAESRVNLEPALKLGQPFGGHWVQGHVDIEAVVHRVETLGEHREIEFSIPDGYSRYIVAKGSVTLDGVSLTVASRDETTFSVAVIPHTLEVTTFSDIEKGDSVNLEVDVLSKYVIRAVEGYLDNSPNFSSQWRQAET